MKFAVCRLIVCALIAISTIGCSGDQPGKPLAITGTVTLDGKPLINATVGFSAISEGIPAKYRYASAETESDGTFSVPEIYPAEYMVTLNEGVEPEGDPNSGMVAAVPGNAKLANYSNNSPLRAKVTPEETNFKFEAVSTPLN